MAATLVLGTVISTAFGFQARWAEAAALAARDDEVQQREAAEAINTFWLDDVLSQAIALARSDARGRHPDADLTVLTLIDQASKEIHRAFADQPKVAAEVHRRIAGFYADTSFVTKGPARWERLEKSQRHLLKSLELYEQELGEEDELTLRSMKGAGLLTRNLAKFADAAPFLERVLKIRQRTCGPGHPKTTEAANELAGVYAAQQRFAEAETLRLATLADSERVQGPEAFPTVTAKYGLGSLYSIRGRYNEALPVLEEGLASLVRDPQLDPTVHTTRHVLNTLGVVYTRLGRYPDAVDRLRKAVKAARDPSVLDSTTVAYLANLGLALLRQRQFGAAEETLRQALEPWTQKRAESWDGFYIRSLLGESLAGQGKYAEAAPFLLGGYDGLKASANDPAARSWSESSWKEGVQTELTTSGGSAGSALRDAGERIVQLYEAWGKPDKAAEWRARLAQPEPAGSPKP